MSKTLLHKAELQLAYVNMRYGRVTQEYATKVSSKQLIIQELDTTEAAYEKELQSVADYLSGTHICPVRLNAIQKNTANMAQKIHRLRTESNQLDQSLIEIRDAVDKAQKEQEVVQKKHQLLINQISQARFLKQEQEQQALYNRRKRTNGTN